MTKWEEKRLGDLATIISGGTPSTSVSEYWNGNIGWITPADLSNYQYRYISQGKRNISTMGLEHSSACLLPKNTVLLSSRAPIGYVAIASCELTTNQGFKNLHCNKKQADFKFMYYWLKQNSAVLKSFASGATFPELSSSRIKRIKARFPDITAQRQIGNILSAYDDLIENNNKRIALLEKVAQELYKEWFVRFRFPGYENAEFENGLPKGWKIEKLGNICEVVTGKKDVNQAQSEGLYPFFSCARDTTLFSDTFLIEDSAILISGNGSYTGFVKKWDGKFDLYQRTYALYKFSPHQWLYMFWCLKNNFETIYMGGSHGCAIPYITKPDILKFKFILPSQDILDQADMYFQNCHKFSKELREKNTNLIKQRDLLLPRLMSGKLEV